MQGWPGALLHKERFSFLFCEGLRERLSSQRILILKKQYTPSGVDKREGLAEDTETWGKTRLPFLSPRLLLAPWEPSFSGT